MNGIELVRLDATVLIWIEGVLESTRAPALEQALASVFTDRSVRTIVIDMSNVLGIDDRAIAVLAAGVAQPSRRRGPIQLMLPRGFRATAGDAAALRLVLEQLYPDAG
jgi:anti-anti-sigma regulatory factor